MASPLRFTHSCRRLATVSCRLSSVCRLGYCLNLNSAAHTAAFAFSLSHYRPHLPQTRRNPKGKNKISRPIKSLPEGNISLPD